MKAALIAAALVPLACSAGNASPTPPAHHQDKPMADVVTYRESTNPTISERQVGISNIYARDLPDAKGTVASRVSAVLTIFDPASKATSRETVFAGGVVAIGADHYDVVTVEAGKGGPGSIGLRKQ